MMDSPDGQPSDLSGSADSRNATHRRLWTPWRMQYVGATTSEPGCIFCNRLVATDDVRSLVLHRGTDAFVIMNLFPYNTGHTMVVPNEHTRSPEVASPASIDEMSRLRPPLLRALRRTLNCHGFNLGINVGTAAGAGIAEHLHEHVVPRWTGDANFMPILANTTVMPELLSVTYAKVRAELIRELTGSAEVRCVVLDDEGNRVLVDASGAIPLMGVVENESVWKSTSVMLRTLVGSDLYLNGWAGPIEAAGEGIGLSFGVTQAVPGAASESGWQWVSTADAVSGPAGEWVTNALANCAMNLGPAR